MLGKLKKTLAERWMPETRSTVRAAGSIPALCFRHDMDGCEGKELESFVRTERELGLPSTCFFLRWQVERFGPQMAQVAETGDEIALHSEARPRLEHSVVWLLWLTEAAYRRRLRSQARWIARRGFPPEGHAPHSIHNYLGFQNWINWNTIELATLGTGLRYISDWRIIARAPEGASDFGHPLPPFYRVSARGSVLVIPTSWDDKYFFSSYEDRLIGGAADSQFSGRTVEQALESLTALLETCAGRNIPLVINLHPIHALRGGLDLFGLKKHLAARAAERGIPVMTLARLAEQMSEK